jgi:hypothetical protein
MEGNYQKKIEKIAQAIYLVSNHLKDSEPLKWELRKESIGFLSCIRSLRDEGNEVIVPADLVIDALSTSGRDLESLISLAVISGLISRANGDIIITEITSLLKTFRAVVSESTAKAGFILSEDFFAADPESQERLSSKITKGQSLTFLSDNIKNSSLTKSENKPKSEVKVIKDKKDQRQNQILTLLKNQSNLTIKDFVGVINDCSEKTIQRELIELVDKGIIKKEGERRWSTYSLK